jgi:ribonuclease R
LELLDQLVFEGTIARDSGHRYRAVIKPQTERWLGGLSVNARGFGFVAASGKVDVFVPAEAMGGALHGDTVLVEATGRTPKGTEGNIVDVTTRRNPRVAGVIRRKRSGAWLEPDDTRLRGPIVLTAGYKDVQDGVSAVVKITRFPVTWDENPEAEVVLVLGAPGDPVVEVAKILAREQIEEEHPLAAMQEAAAMDARLRKLKPEGREDLRAVPLLTIDPTDARDHDDAVWAESVGDGFRIYVAIADVSEYVQPGTALDEEANRRGCTIYLPDRAIPMLPGALAADLCSLLPEKERYCLCVIAELDAQAQVKSFRVVEGLMKAAALITYDGAAKTLGFTDKPERSAQAEAFKRDLKVLAAVTGKLRRARLKRGALDLDLPEPKVELNDAGGPEKVSRRAGDPGIKKAYQIVEELMLLANELVARWLGKRKCPAIYRVHGKPDPEKLQKLGAVTAMFDAPFDLEGLQNPLGVADWLREIEKHPQRPVLQGMLLRALKQAVYDVVNVGHFGLASDAYLHFTSPIRRYPDLVVHRTVKNALRNQSPEATPEMLEELRAAATHASARERSAMSVEREVVDIYRAILMRDHIGEIFEGTVSAVVGSGVFVSLVEPFVEVLIRFEMLGPDRYELADDELTVVGIRSGDSVRLGDVVMVEIDDVSILRRSVYGRRIAFGDMKYGDSDADPAPRGVLKPGRGNIRPVSRGAAGSQATSGEKAGPRKAGRANTRVEPTADPRRGRQEKVTVASKLRGTAPTRKKKAIGYAAAAGGKDKPKAKPARSKKR